MRFIPLLVISLLTVGTLSVMADALERCEQAKGRSLNQQHKLGEKDLERIEKRYIACIERESAREERIREKEERLRERMEARGIDYDAIKELNRPKTHQE